MNLNKRYAFAALIAVVAVLFVSGCAKIMDADKIEKASKNLLNEKFGDENFDKVTCPEDEDAKDGVKFDCTYEGSEGTTGKIAISVTSEDGDYGYEISEVKLKTETVQDAIKTDYNNQAEANDAPALTSVDCGDVVFKAPDFGDTSCAIEDAEGSKGNLPVSLSQDLEAIWDFQQITEAS